MAHENGSSASLQESPLAQNEVTKEDVTSKAGDLPALPKGARFWLIFVGLCLAGFVSAMDSTIIFTALPTVARELNGQGEYVWSGNAYVLTSTAIQPLFGQTSNIFGRRCPMIFSVAMFALGSGVAGGATTSAMFNCWTTRAGPWSWRDEHAHRLDRLRSRPHETAQHVLG